MSDAHEPPAADEALVERLRAAARTGDGVPDHVLEAARAAFTLRDLDAELAQLVSDSADATGVGGAARPEPVLMRGDEEPRTLTFEAGSVTVDLEITAVDGLRRVVGIAAGARPGELTVEYDDGNRVGGPLDELGRFALEVPPGRVRLRIPAAGTPVLTPWTTL